jgi:TRAP-type C4-dicarboxylate transport system permease small subunit
MKLAEPAYKVEAAIHVVSGVARKIAMLFLFLMMLLITSDVVGRYCFNHSIIGAADVIDQMLVFIVFLMLAYTTAQKSHVTVNVVISRLPKIQVTMLNCVTSFASLAIAALITWKLAARGWALLLETFQGELSLTTQTIGWPIAPFLIVAAVGAFLLCMELAVDFCTYIAQAVGGRTRS